MKNKVTQPRIRRTSNFYQEFNSRHPEDTGSVRLEQTTIHCRWNTAWLSLYYGRQVQQKGIRYGFRHPYSKRKQQPKNSSKHLWAWHPFIRSDEGIAHEQRISDTLANDSQTVEKSNPFRQRHRLSERSRNKYFEIWNRLRIIDPGNQESKKIRFHGQPWKGNGKWRTFTRYHCQEQFPIRINWYA